MGNTNSKGGSDIQKALDTRNWHKASRLIESTPPKDIADYRVSLTLPVYMSCWNEEALWSYELSQGLTWT